MPAVNRLKARGDFSAVNSRGRKFVTRFFVFRALPAETPESRFGVTVSNRVGKATVRNRVKRLVRENLRARLQQIGPGWDIVCIARQASPEAGFLDVGGDIDRLTGFLGQASREAGRKQFSREAGRKQH